MELKNVSSKSLRKALIHIEKCEYDADFNPNVLSCSDLTEEEKSDFKYINGDFYLMLVYEAKDRFLDENL